MPPPPPPPFTQQIAQLLAPLSILLAAVCFIKFTCPLTSEEFGAELASAGISVKPAYCFGPPESITGDVDYFRVGFGEAKMPLALAALARFVTERQGEWRDLGARRSRL